MALGGETVGRAYVRLIIDGTDLPDSIRDEMRDADPTIRRAGRRHARIYGRALARENGLERFAQRIDALGGRVARVFGKGSRNNFLNFFGSFTGGLVHATAVIPRLLGRVTALGSVFSQGFDKARDSGDGFFKSFLSGSSALSNALLTSIPGLIVLAATIVAAVAAIGPLVALVSALTAALVALAGSVAFAVVGALAPLVGLLLPLAGGIGVVTAAVLGMSDSMKSALQKAVDPLLTSLQRMAKETANIAFGDLDKQIGKLRPVVKSLEPILTGVAKSIRTLIGEFADSLNGPAFTLFLNSMKHFLPEAVLSLGRIFSNIGGIFIGVFRALIPVTREFLGWIQRITGDFSAFANSARGQNQMRDFFRRAALSAKAVGRALLEIGGAIGDLFSSGRKEGDSVFDSLRNQARKLRDYLKANPDAVKEWFRNGVAVAKQIGTLILGIINAVRKLDTPENRRIVKAVFETMIVIVRQAARVIATLVAGTRKAWEWAGKAGRALQSLGRSTGVSAVLRGIADAMGAIAGAARDAWQWVGNLIDKIAQIPGVRDSFTIDKSGRAGGVTPRLANDPAVTMVGTGRGTSVTTVNRAGKTVNVGGVTVISPSADPTAVAQETINRLVATAY